MYSKNLARSKFLTCFTILAFLINACGIGRSISSISREIRIVPYDDDNDGFTLSLDKCPNTKPEDIDNVDSHGCVVDDEDGDTVSLPFDECPNTPKGEKVWKSNGCMDHYYYATVELLAEDGTLVKGLVSYGYEMTAAATLEAVVSLIPAWLPGYPFAHAGAPRVETHSKDDSPEPKCINEECSTERPKSPDDFGDRFGIDFGNKNSGNSTTGEGTGGSPSSPPSPSTGTPGSVPTEGGAIEGSDGNPSGSTGGNAPTSPDPSSSSDPEDNWGNIDLGGNSNNPDNSSSAENDGNQPIPPRLPLPKAPLPTIPVKDKGPTSSGGGTTPVGNQEEIAQVLSSVGLKTQADSPYAPRLYKVAKSLQNLEGKTTERIQSPQAATMFQNMIQVAKSSLGKADDYYSVQNEGQGNSFLYVASMMAEAAYDLATSDLGKEILTSVGPAAEIRDLYEAATGRSIFDDHELTNWERGMAVIGAATGGVGSKVFKGLTIADKILGVGMMVKKIGKPLGQAENAAEIAVREARAIQDITKEKYDLARKIQAATGVNLRTTWNGVKVGFKKEEEVYAHRDLLSRWQDDFKVEKIVDASEVNKTFVARGEEACYKEGTKAIEFRSEANEIFFRVHGPDNATRGWVLKKQDIEGLSALEIQNKFNIPGLPTQISEVHVPKGTLIRNGVVGETISFGKSEGAIQYEIQERVLQAWIKNTTDLF